MKFNSIYEVAVALLLVRILAHGASLGESLAMLALVAVLGLHKYLEHIKKPDPSEELRQELKSLTHNFQGELEGLKTKVEKILAASLLNGRR